MRGRQALRICLCIGLTLSAPWLSRKERCRRLGFLKVLDDKNQIRYSKFESENKKERNRESKAELLRRYLIR